MKQNKKYNDDLRIGYKRSNFIYGGLIYAVGDTIASLLLGEFGWVRLLGMLLIGATLYAIEIPAYFKWIEKKVPSEEGLLPKIQKTLLAILYFNPLWVARHLLLIKLFSLQVDQINFELVQIAWLSFLGTIPISILANYIIQNLIKLDWRYIGSSIFSALMALYYAFSATFFA